MSKEQHGFMPNESIINNLLAFNDFTRNTHNSNPVGQVDSAYLDFSKAFDSIDHTILIKKTH